MHVKITRGRRIASVCIVLFFFAFFALDLVKIQIFEGEEYDAASTAVSERTATISAARGEIVDCNGSPLIYNSQGYTVIFDAAYFPASDEHSERNAIILSLIKLFEEKSLEWIDILPLVFDANGNIVYKDDSDSLIKEMKSADMLKLNEYATARNCFDALIDRFELQGYNPHEARKIASVRYGMMRIYFKIGTPYVFAENVPDETVSLIKENNGFYKGVDVRVDPVRNYTDGTLAPHILGRIGAIDAEEYAEKKSLGYKITDQIGKSGIEAAMEEYLKGKDGTVQSQQQSEANQEQSQSDRPQHRTCRTCR